VPLGGAHERSRGATHEAAVSACAGSA
jgi:hypothetical protein